MCSETKHAQNGEYIFHRNKLWEAETGCVFINPPPWCPYMTCWAYQNIFGLKKKGVYLAFFWLVQKGGWQKNKSTCLVNLINKMRWVYFMLWRKQVRTASVTSVHIRPMQHVCFLKRNACKQYTKIICLQVIQGAKKKGSHIHIPKDMSVGKTYLHPTKQNQTHT